jgi:hypothetical protein
MESAIATKPKKKRARLGDTVSSTPIMRDRRGLGALLAPPVENWTGPLWHGWTIADEAVIKAKAEKHVRGLMPAYGINPADPNAWMQLAIRLADEYHRGFRVIDQKLRGRGAPRKDNETTSAVAARVAQGMPARTACYEVAAETGKNPGTIETRYYKDLRENPTAKVPKRRSRGGARP